MDEIINTSEKETVRTVFFTNDKIKHSKSTACANDALYQKTNRESAVWETFKIELVDRNIAANNSVTSYQPMKS
jgi:hypothetical protein